MALGFAQGGANAAWSYMGHIDGHAVMIDRTSVQLKGRNALVWMLTNYSSVTVVDLDGFVCELPGCTLSNQLTCERRRHELI